MVHADSGSVLVMAFFSGWQGYFVGINLVWLRKKRASGNMFGSSANSVAK
jgi:hypothetical protein